MQILVSLMSLLTTATTKNAVILPSLQAGHPPPNAVAYVSMFQILFSSDNHLLDDDFNQLAPLDHAGDLMSQLVAKRAERAAAASASSSSSSQDGGSASPDVKEEHKGGFVSGVSVVSYAPRPLALGQFSTTVPFFLCPLSDKAEDTQRRERRMFLWATVVATLSNHPHVFTTVHPVGNFCGLATNILGLCTVGKRSTAIALLGDVVKLASHPPHPWHSLAQELSRLASVHAGVDDVRMRMGDGILPEFALRALEHFPEFAVDLSLLRKITNEDVTIQRIISDISARAAELPASARKAVVSGHVAASAPPVRGVCFQFRDQGKCSKGDACRFSHGSTSTGGSGGACYECGSAHHSIDACPDYVKRARPPNNRGNSRAAGTAKANAARIKDLEGQLAAQLALTAPSASSPAAGVTGHMASAAHPAYRVYDVNAMAPGAP